MIKSAKLFMVIVGALFLSNFLVPSAVATPLYVGTNAYRIPNAPATGPQAAIAQMNLRWLNGSTFIEIPMCTAWFYGAKTAASSAHCLTDDNGAVYPSTRWYFRVARNSNSTDTALTQSQSCYLAGGANILTGSWAVSPAPADDWALFRTTCTVSYWFPVIAEPYYYGNTNAWVTGHPGVEVYSWSVGTMFEDNNLVTKQGPRFYYHKADSWSGQSGAPVFKSNCGAYGAYCAIGVNKGSVTFVTTSNVAHAPDVSEVNRWACFRDTPSSSC